MLEIEDAVALENTKIPWTSQEFCATTEQLIAWGAAAIVGLILVAVALILVTWRCTKCLAWRQDDEQTPSEIKAELENGK